MTDTGYLRTAAIALLFCFSIFNIIMVWESGPVAWVSATTIFVACCAIATISISDAQNLHGQRALIDVLSRRANEAEQHAAKLRIIVQDHLDAGGGLNNYRH